MADTSFSGKKVLVQGLGSFGGGVGVARWLAMQGARVTVTDTAAPEKLTASIAALADVPVTLKLGGHDLADFTTCDLLVVNPAVDKATSPHVQAAMGAGIPLTTEMNLFVERCRGQTIGITGSVGKSTTTALIYHALKAGLAGTAGPRVFLGGNIGKSLLADLEQIGPQDVVVLELSSFMLEDTPRVGWSPHIAVVTNLVPNHLDRHGTMAAYGHAKQNVLAFQTAADTAVINADDAVVAPWTCLAKGKVVTFTTQGVAPLPLVMPGLHNQSNTRAALAVLEALPLSLDKAAALRAIQEFPGLAHRLQCVHRAQHIAGRGQGVEVRWFNDSKATSPQASITALQAFAPGTAICVVGGYDKKIDMTEFIRALAERAAGVLGIGQTGAALVEAVRRVGGGGGPRAEYVETLERAVRTATEWIASIVPPTSSYLAVLLSPASASWGQYQNY